MGVLFASGDIQNELSKYPESGMGFRLINATINYTIQNLSGEISGKFLVLNSIYLFPYKLDHKPNDIQFLTIEDLWKNEDNIFNINKIEIQAIKNIILGFSMFDNEPPNDNIEIAPSFLFRKQKLITRTLTGSNEIYFRFSCHEDNDMVDSNTGDFKPGTYATTLSDIRLVPSGFAAVGRYALPNPMSAKFVSVIIPPKGIRIWKGTVTPNHGQAGGGVEVYFPDGAENLIGHSYCISES